MKIQTKIRVVAYWIGKFHIHHDIYKRIVRKTQRGIFIEQHQPMRNYNVIILQSGDHKNTEKLQCLRYYYY